MVFCLLTACMFWHKVNKSEYSTKRRLDVQPDTFYWFMEEDPCLNVMPSTNGKKKPGAGT